MNKPERDTHTHHPHTHHPHTHSPSQCGASDKEEEKQELLEHHTSPGASEAAWQSRSRVYSSAGILGADSWIFSCWEKSQFIPRSISLRVMRPAPPAAARVRIRSGSDYSRIVPGQSCKNQEFILPAEEPGNMSTPAFTLLNGPL
ncbi:hypothetical protein AMECASPLE_019687 [Ameca splendens]|uniref:Uncharacterized protein n=1 Tax=Ameca splendens TaxID=208324 RepID=A0ABV0Y333_9TELE